MQYGDSSSNYSHSPVIVRTIYGQAVRWMDVGNDNTRREKNAEDKNVTCVDALTLQAISVGTHSFNGPLLCS